MANPQNNKDESSIAEYVLKLQCRAFRLHGITKEQFLSLTPREFDMIERDYGEEFSQIQKMWDCRFANLMHLMYSMNRGKGSKKLSPDDFMPKYENEKKPEPKSADQLMAGLRHFELIEESRQRADDEKAAKRKFIKRHKLAVPKKEIPPSTTHP